MAIRTSSTSSVTGLFTPVETNLDAFLRLRLQCTYIHKVSLLKIPGLSLWMLWGRRSLDWINFSLEIPEQYECNEGDN